MAQYEVNEQWGDSSEKKMITQYQISIIQGTKQIIMTVRLVLPKSKWVLKLESLLKSNYFTLFFILDQLI